MEFSRQAYWSGLSFPSPKDLPGPGTETGSPALQADSLLSETPGKHLYMVKFTLFSVQFYDKFLLLYKHHSQCVEWFHNLPKFSRVIYL